MTTTPSATSRQRRAAAARAALARACGQATPAPTPAQTLLAPSVGGRWGLDEPAALRLLLHNVLVLVVAAVLLSQLLGMPAHPTPEVAFHAEELPSAPTNVACHSDLIASVAVQFAPCLDEAPFVALNISVPRRPVPIIPHEPAAPALQRPLDIPDAFLTSHTLAAGETLGDLARRYDLPLATLIWANYLDRGDALIVGQTLRIPRTPGLSHRVAPGETLNQLAERFAIAPEAIATFPPNAIGDDLRLIPGSEIFVPAGTRPLPQEWLAAKGDWEGLARWGPEPAGVVRAPQTNLRNGPSTEHVRVIQLEAGRQLALKARYQDWLLVVIGTNQGWVRQDLLHLDPEVVAALPESNDFPPPPPRWVWPAYGRLTSGFGPRWGGFHDGIDIASRAWSPILAARSGRVSEAGWCRGYGYCVKLQHGGGVMTTYGHLITTPLVRVGDDVDAGQLIGHMGSTYDRAGGGFSTGIHLHFSIKINGRAVDPLRFLP